MEAKRICPYCMGELESRVSVCPHCGGVLAGRNPAGSLPVGTLLAGRYTVGEMQSIDGEGILYRGVENIGRFRVTIKEYAGVSILYTMFAKYIILILYGEAYLPAITPMRIVTWYIAFSYLGDARNVWVISYDCQKYLKYLYIGSAITNVVMNYFLIPLFGASGAAFASVVTQISTIMIFPLFIRKMRPNVKLMLDAICLKDVF